jgi:hypothetical protein
MFDTFSGAYAIAARYCAIHPLLVPSIPKALLILILYLAAATVLSLLRFD